RDPEFGRLIERDVGGAIGDDAKRHGPALLHPAAQYTGATPAPPKHRGSGYGRSHSFKARCSATLGPHAGSAAMRPQRIVLIGLSGSGKSAVARQVARRLHWTWADSDDVIVSESGKEIAAIFSEFGEAEFRRLERQAIERLAQGERVVIATGGGAVLDAANRAALWRDAFVVHLETRPSTLARRMAESRRGLAHRPLLEGGDPRERLERLRAERGPIYALADWTIRTDGLTSADVVSEVIGAWERRSA